LTGCDYLTISPQLLGELQKADVAVVKKLDATKAKCEIPRFYPDHKVCRFSLLPAHIGTYCPQTFMWQLNEDEMAHFKLAEVCNLCASPRFYS
jgi:transaldolase